MAKKYFIFICFLYFFILFIDEDKIKDNNINIIRIN